MADPNPPDDDDDDDPEPEGAKSRYLIALWDCLDPANSLSVRADVLDHLDEIRVLLERAVELLRQGPPEED